jgi:hypothetical protein
MEIGGRRERERISLGHERASGMGKAEMGEGEMR